MDSDAEALGPAELQGHAAGTLQSLEATAPEILGKLWRMALIDGAINCQWICRIRRLSGRARMPASSARCCCGFMFAGSARLTASTCT
ncbi:hypothetical protein [Paracoccus sp. (in: a-proteobacteria)]|uniref:hypothetical protein n=1 Tax=Paracoccus sp. TaxID=267 RepID=UPI0026DF1F3B|nr:hypothetical protein [Paracoccus sp. (in: a-proteobacteria)]MDO5370865.1 hypothetical protein [Paracoccus sp. (in: a-proteobacteria)]